MTDAAFTIPSTTPLGSTVCYNITITGDYDQEVTEMFPVTVSTVNSLDQILGADTVTVTIVKDNDGERYCLQNIEMEVLSLSGATLLATTYCIQCN